MSLQICIFLLRFHICQLTDRERKFHISYDSMVKLNGLPQTSSVDRGEENEVSSSSSSPVRAADSCLPSESPGREEDRSSQRTKKRGRDGCENHKPHPSCVRQQPDDEVVRPQAGGDLSQECRWPWPQQAATEKNNIRHYSARHNGSYLTIFLTKCLNMPKILHRRKWVLS